MTSLLVATRSRGKQREFRDLLAPLGREILFPDDLGLAETPEESGLEVFESFEANARAKAAYFHRRSGLPTLADDSGLEVDALQGAPGVHSKRFAGRDGHDHDVTAANNEELLRRLADVDEAARRARYRCVLVLIGDGREVVVEGASEGRILRAPRGTGGFGYDPLFLSADLGKTFAEATAEEKARVSHRGRAVRELVGKVRVR